MHSTVFLLLVVTLSNKATNLCHYYYQCIYRYFSFSAKATSNGATISWQTGWSY